MFVSVSVGQCTGMRDEVNEKVSRFSDTVARHSSFIRQLGRRVSQVRKREQGAGQVWGNSGTRICATRKGVKCGASRGQVVNNSGIENGTGSKVQCGTVLGQGVGQGMSTI